MSKILTITTPTQSSLVTGHWGKGWRVRTSIAMRSAMRVRSCATRAQLALLLILLIVLDKIAIVVLSRVAMD